MAVDLHTHSNLSDGDYSPEELVTRAKEKGLTAFAVSDHDTLEGSRRALIKGKELGVKVVPAVEISASSQGKVLHVLAYGVDIENEELHRTLADIVEYRIERAKSIVQGINQELEVAGKPSIDIEAILNLGKEKPITRIDIAEYLIKKGYVQSRDEAFSVWLNKYNVPNRDLSVVHACALTHKAGGVAILAHPNSPFLSLNEISEDFEEHKRIILELKEGGLDGIEVYRSSQSAEDQEKYLTFAISAELLVTGGSDFHSPDHVKTPDIGAAQVPDQVMEGIELALTRNKKDL